MNKTSLSFLPACLYVTGYLYALTIPAIAQITTDGTVNTRVDRDGNVAEITGGETRGDNLFHSFGDFSVRTGNEAFFNNANNISNIFNRVTGGNISNIDGIIRANGSANLFLINPAGIIFGENARLDVGGSFYGSSASSILFEDGEFSAVDLDNPPLLTVNAPIGLGFRDNPGDITNRANSGLVEQTFEQDITSEIIEVSRVTNIDGLEVDRDRDIALVGGDIFLEGSGINAPGGNITLGGLSGAGEVSINPDGSFSFPDNVDKADLSLSDSALVSIIDDGGGSINIDVNNLRAIEQSRIVSGIAEDMGNSDAVGGDITINADESVTLVGSNDGIGEPEIDLDTVIRSVVGLPPARLNNPEEDTSSAIGDSGSVVVNTRQLNLSELSGIGIGVYGTGNGQDVTVNAETISLNQGAIVNQIRPDGRGDSGNVNITTNDFSATNLSFVITDNKGIEGSAGDINLVATGSVVLQDDIFSAFISEIEADTVGNAGDINLTAESLLIDNNFQLSSLTRGRGNGGDINLEIADSLVISNGADVIAQIGEGGEGNAGNIAIDTNTFELSRNSLILADNLSAGDAGDITINAIDSVSIDGGGENLGETLSAILSQVQNNVVGDAGDITITTPQLSLNNFGLISTNVKEGSVGSTGDIVLNVDTLSLDNGSVIDALTENDFDGGSINVNADIVNLNNGGKIVTSAIASGNAGSININVNDTLTISNDNPPITIPFFEDILIDTASESGLFSSTVAGTGNGGNIEVNAGSLELASNGSISATTASGTGGNVFLNVKENISLRNDSLISAEAAGFGSGGNITIDTNFIVAFPDGNNDILANADRGQGGNITIDATSVFGIVERPLDFQTNDINATSEVRGLDGNISITTPDINPVRDTAKLPSKVVEPEAIAQQVCQNNREVAAESGLSVRGKGGIQAEPGLPLNSSNILTDDRTNSHSVVPEPIETSKGKIQPARGVRLTESGELILTANINYSQDDNNLVPQRQGKGSRNCGGV